MNPKQTSYICTGGDEPLTRNERGKRMKKLVAAFAVIFVFALPIAALKAQRDAKSAEELTGAEAHAAVSAPVSEITEPELTESIDTTPPLTAKECIALLNASYEQMWSEREAPKADAPAECAARYAISDEERGEIERIVASEGGYCPYEFQALVAECILNGCESEDMRPSELFARGDFYITHNLEPTEVTKQAVSDVFDLGVMPTHEKVRYYYNPKFCASPTHESFRYVLTSCDCRFFADWE